VALAIVYPFDIISREGLHSSPVIGYLEGANSVYTKGAPLVNSSGYLVEATYANPYNGTGTVGIAVAPANNVSTDGGANPTTGDKYKLLYPALPHLEFVGQLDASSSTAAQGTHALAQTDLWHTYGITRDGSNGSGSNLWYVNFSDTSDVRVVVTALIDPIGTIAGRVQFKFLFTATDTIWA
jgi:hypothetical protein